MLDYEKHLKRKNERLEKQIKELKRENFELRQTMQYFNDRVRVLNEKEDEYNKMLEELAVLKKHYVNAIDKTKNIRKEIKKQMKQFT